MPHRKNQQSWTIAHLEAQEPDAAPYLADEWDDSTLASTPSMKRGFATILRHGEEPSHIIISVERKLSKSKCALQKLWRALQKLFESRKRLSCGSGGSGISQVSATEQPSLGVNGVLV
jgi:hypothetical protein